MRKNRLFQLRVACLLVFTLFFNVIGSAYAASSIDADGNRVLLCTAKGYAWVSFDDIESPTSSSVERCQLCVLHQSLNDSPVALLDQTPEFCFETGIASTQNFKQFNLLQSQQNYLFAYGRAPPKNTL